MDASHDVTFGNRGEAKQGPAEARLAVEKERVWWQREAAGNLHQGQPCNSLGFAHPDMCKYMCRDVHVYKYSSSPWPSHWFYTVHHLPPILSCLTAKEHHG